MKASLLEKPDLATAADRILEKYLTVRECAEFLRISEATVRYYLTKKMLRRFKVGARTVIRLRDAEALVREA
jgi:predicted transcriptional regulator